MNLLKSTLAFALLFQIINGNAQKNSTQQKTNAEISAKLNGQWKAKKYEGGTFKNIQNFDLSPNHTDHSFDIRFEGPGWESNKIAYRLYLDWRNAIDLFGKTTEEMVLPKIGLDGFESYHLKNDWGSDILKVGKGMGLGSIGRIVDKEMYHFNKVDATNVKVSNSAKSSSILISYKGWQTLKDNINLTTKLEIFPDTRYTKATTTPSKAISGIAVGIVKLKNLEILQKTGTAKKWSYIATYGAQSMFDDNLGMVVFYQNSTVEKLVDGPFDHLLVFKPTTKPILYYFEAAWVNEVGGIKKQEEFMKYINTRLEELDSKGKFN